MNWSLTKCEVIFSLCYGLLFRLLCFVARFLCHEPWKVFMYSRFRFFIVENNQDYLDIRSHNCVHSCTFHTSIILISLCKLFCLTFWWWMAALSLTWLQWSDWLHSDISMNSFCDFFLFALYWAWLCKCTSNLYANNILWINVIHPNF
jgi:hypothetical protein